MKVAVYYRVSTDKQDFDSQRIRLDQYCAAKGYTDIQVFSDEAVSGNNDHRPGFNALLAAARSSAIDVVVTYELDRLSRNFMTMLTAMQVFSEHNVRVEVPDAGIQNFGTAMDMLLVAIKAYKAQSDNEMTRTRIKAGLAAARKRGVRLGGARPGSGPKPKLTAEQLQRVATMRGAGDSFRTIAARLNVTHKTVSRALSKLNQ